jgi:hypothetical protein
VTRWAAGPLDLLAGAVTYDRLLPHPSPYQRWYGLNHRKTAARACEYLRGYYWANLLTAGQLARLGSRAALEAGAADHEIWIDPVPDTPAGRETVLFRSAHPIRAFDDRRLARCPVRACKRRTAAAFSGCGVPVSG